jgi:hypothetical protein
VSFTCNPRGTSQILTIVAESYKDNITKIAKFKHGMNLNPLVRDQRLSLEEIGLKLNFETITPLSKQINLHNH